MFSYMFSMFLLFWNIFLPLSLGLVIPAMSVVFVICCALFFPGRKRWNIAY